MGACCSKGAEIDVDEVNRANDATGGLAETYEVKHLLGSGSAGDAWLCRDRASGELLAVKLMKRPIPPLMGTNIMREVKIGAQLGKGHLNIVKPRELILTRTHLGLVMEYVAGGNMADYILKTILLKFGSFDTRDGLVMEEDEARYFFTQIISAVEYCHNNKVAHRDLKMDNTLLDDNDPPRIKLCDFGFAKWWTQEPQMSTITGTPDYMSPQLLGAKAHNQAALYDATKADIWAAGVMLCVMLIGRFPFEGIEMSNATNLEEVSAHVWRQQNSARWLDNPLIAQDCSMLSAECIDLLDKMFELDESQRISIGDIRRHPWFSKPLPPLYQAAMDEMTAEQARMDQQVRQAAAQQLQQLQQARAPPHHHGQVAAGAFVNKDRDSALKRMILLAASRYSPEQEEPLTAMAAGGAGGGVTLPDGMRLTPSMLRKISLTAILPYQYEQVAANRHADLATISDFFSESGGADVSTGGGGDALVQQQQQQQQQQQPGGQQALPQQQEQLAALGNGHPAAAGSGAAPDPGPNGSGAAPAAAAAVPAVPGKGGGGLGGEIQAAEDAPAKLQAALA